MPYHVNNEFKEVYFNEYCKTCEHEKIKDIQEPCNECLDNPVNLHSHKPVNYEAKKD